MLAKGEDKSRKLELNLKSQQFFFEASEIESWLLEKNNMLSSTDCGRDRDAASKLLTKHKVCATNIKFLVKITLNSLL